jgi:hypothetical protein
MAYTVKRRGKLKHPAALRSKVMGRPRLNKRQGLKAYRTGKTV